MAEPPTVTFSFTVELICPDVMQILLNGSPDGISVPVEAQNAGAAIAEVTVITHSGDDYDGPLVLGGPDGAKFTLSKGGDPPCDLCIGPTSLAGGAYDIKLTAP